MFSIFVIYDLIDFPYRKTALILESGVPIARTRGDWYQLDRHYEDARRPLTEAEQSLPELPLQPEYCYAGGRVTLPDWRRIIVCGNTTREAAA